MKVTRLTWQFLTVMAYQNGRVMGVQYGLSGREYSLQVKLGNSKFF